MESCQAVIEKIEETAARFSDGNTGEVWKAVIAMGELQSGIASANLGREQERQERLLQFFTVRKFWIREVMEEYRSYLLPYRTGRTE